MAHCCTAEHKFACVGVEFLQVGFVHALLVDEVLVHKIVDVVSRFFTFVYSLSRNFWFFIENKRLMSAFNIKNSD